MSSVYVTVSVNSMGQVCCSPDPAPVSGTNALITFNLATSGYAFPSNNAITVINPESQFPYGPWNISSASVGLFDANTDENSYKYTVHVIRLSDNTTLEYDPMIENGK